MTELHEQSSPNIYEKNLKEVNRMIDNHGKRHQYARSRNRILKRLAIFYTEINEQFEGSKLVRSKI